MYIYIWNKLPIFNWCLPKCPYDPSTFSFPSKTFFHQGTFVCKCRVPSLCPPPKNLQANVDPHKRHSRNCRKETRILPRKKREVYLNSGGDWGIYLSWQINSRHKSVKMIRTIIRWNPYAKHRVFHPNKRHPFTSGVWKLPVKSMCQLLMIQKSCGCTSIRFHMYNSYIYIYLYTFLYTYSIYVYISW